MARDFDSEFIIGNKIRRFRTYRGLTQKQLAEACGISESAIRNYELGNRIPDALTLRDISDALNVSLDALRDPNPNDVYSAVHFLYELEELYGLTPSLIDGEIHLTFKKQPESFPELDEFNAIELRSTLLKWITIREKYDSNEFTYDDYFKWQTEYPDYEGDYSSIEYHEIDSAEWAHQEAISRQRGGKPMPFKDSDGKWKMKLPDSEEVIAATAPKRKRKPKSN